MGTEILHRLSATTQGQLEALLGPTEPPVSAEEDVPLEGGIRDHWRAAVFETDAQGRQRVNRLTYEIGVLQTLRDQLRCKEV